MSKKYYDHVIRHNGLEKTVNARNGSREKKQRKAKTNRGERHQIYSFGTLATASRVADDRHWLLKDLGSENKRQEKALRFHMIMTQLHNTYRSYLVLVTGIGFVAVTMVNFPFHNSPGKLPSISVPLDCAIYILTTDIIFVEDYPVCNLYSNHWHTYFGRLSIVRFIF